MARTEDSHFAMAASTAGLEPGLADVEEAQPGAFPAIAVRKEVPALNTARMVPLGANNLVLPLLPQDPRRHRAVILAIDNAVWVCNSEDIAWQVQGTTTTGTQAFYLPTSTPLEVKSQGALWVSSTTSSTSRVSVLIEKDDE